ncbi:MAG: nucleotidyltransferase family protein [Myxococcales bacterium]|nr:nucleotidyltransferase family protein [Myxococcales bacterium]
MRTADTRRDRRGARAPAAIVLAAGASSRMGQAKALLRWRGESFLRRTIWLAEQAGCAPIVVVEGAAALPAEELGGAALARNETWSNGQFSSLRCGLAWLARHATPEHGALVLTVDRPHVRADTVRELLAAHRRAPRGIYQPAHAGRRGHPILFPSFLRTVLLALPAHGDNSPRVLFRLPEVGALRRSVAVDDPAVLENIDTPEDYRRLLARDGDGDR